MGTAGQRERRERADRDREPLDQLHSLPPPRGLGGVLRPNPKSVTSPPIRGRGSNYRGTPSGRQALSITYRTRCRKLKDVRAGRLVVADATRTVNM